MFFNVFDSIIYIIRSQLLSNSARSSVAYEYGPVEEDNISIQSACTSTGSSQVPEDDEFTKLKLERDKQRHDRALKKFARSTSENQPTSRSSVDLSRENLLLGELAEASRISFSQANHSDNYRESDNV